MEMIVVVGLVGVVMCVVAVFALYKSGTFGSQPNTPMAKTTEPRWQVWFAGDWYECQLVSEDSQRWGQLVRLTDRRTHSRVISRMSNCIRQV